MSEPKKKSFWGKGIVLLYSGFVAFMLILVVFVSTQDFSLVENNYYESDRNYQKQIDRLNRTQKLKQDIKLEFNPVSGRLIINYPSETIDPDITGRIKLYRPSDAGYDRSYEVVTDAAGRQVIEAKGLVRGLWRVKITWGRSGLEYFSQIELIIE